MREPIRHLYIPIDDLKRLVGDAGILSFEYDKGTKIVSRECAKRLRDTAGIPAVVTPDEMGVFTEYGLLKRAVTRETGIECLHFWWDSNDQALDFSFLNLERGND